jgi:acetyltransferase-like isoleucine patch superfamily enzyme
VENQAYELPLRSVGQDVVIYERAKILAPERISIGDSVIVDDFAFISGGQDTRVGSFVHVAAFVLVAGGGRLTLEDFAGLSGGVRLYTGDDDYLGGSLTGPTVPDAYREPVRSFVSVGRHCIVGANTVILPGVTIGEGAAVGANSLLKRDCDPWTVYVGTPARAVRERPRHRMLELERELRQQLYDEDGRYIPRHRRGGN